MHKLNDVFRELHHIALRDDEFLSVFSQFSEQIIASQLPPKCHAESNDNIINIDFLKYKFQITYSLDFKEDGTPRGKLAFYWLNTIINELAELNHLLFTAQSMLVDDNGVVDRGSNVAEDAVRILLNWLYNGIHEISSP
jgi:hypothetical protein